MSLLKNYRYSWLSSFVIKVLNCGPVPRHIAFIMDGNRRYAEKKGIPRTEGHGLGNDKVQEVFQWCVDLGIGEVSVYAFSIENFERSEEEVTKLIDLFTKTMEQLLEKKEDLDKDGICIRVLGDLSLLPVSLQQIIGKLVLSTQSNTRFYFNLYLSYTSREEMANATREIAEGINKGLLIQSDVTEELFTSCFYAPDSPPVDLLVRTSGEVRLSDFLLWQSSHAVLLFAKVNWPELSIWYLLATVLSYQRNQRRMSQNQQTIKLFERRNTSLNNCAVSEMDSLGSFDALPEDTESEERKKNFLSYLRCKRLKQLEDMRAGLTKQNKPCFDVAPSSDHKMQ